MPSRPIVVLLALAVITLAGCTSPQPSASGHPVKFNGLTGTLTTEEPASVDATVRAAQSAIDELQLRTGDKSQDALKGIIRARTAEGDSVIVTVQRISSSASSVSIDTGPLGKEKTARLILDKLEKHLR